VTGGNFRLYFRTNILCHETNSLAVSRIEKSEPQNRSFFMAKYSKGWLQTVRHKRKRGKMMNYAHESKKATVYTSPNQIIQPQKHIIPDLAATQAVHSGSSPIQRRVMKFKCDSDNCDPPTNDLLESIDYGYFKESEDVVKDAITGAVTPTKASVTDRPNEIKATIGTNGKSDSNPDRKTSKSGQIGKFGSNEYFLRAGGAYEVFEGGHLIPHELWSERDPDVASADDYVNLVPMSRTMNVGVLNSWRTIERQMLEFAANLKGKENFEVVVKVNHEDYRLSYNQLAALFKLNVDNAKHDGTNSIVLYNWLPTSISAVRNPTKATEVDMGEVAESQIHNTSARIATGGELIEVLKSTPIWNRMSASLQGKVEKI
jgi:hypothetical protein